jgi:hypothetical protein
MLLGPSLVVST